MKVVARLEPALSRSRSGVNLPLAGTAALEISSDSYSALRLVRITAGRRTLEIGVLLWKDESESEAVRFDICQIYHELQHLNKTRRPI
jgi:hypothetical protein